MEKKDKQKEYYHNNREHILEMRRLWYKRNKEKCINTSLDYYYKHKKPLLSKTPKIKKEKSTQSQLPKELIKSPIILSESLNSKVPPISKKTNEKIEKFLNSLKK